MVDGQNKKIPLEQKDAEQIARLFNVAFNSAFLYGGSHPTTSKNTIPFYSSLSNVLKNQPLVSLIVDRESVFVEEWCVDKIINTKRILTQFTKNGIQSVSFGRGTGIDAVENFISMAGNNQEIFSAQAIERDLHSRGITSVILNYVRYGKITSDQEVIGRDQIADGQMSEGRNAAGESGLSNNSIEQIEQVLSLASLLNQPQKTVAAFSEAACDPHTAQEALSSIERLRSEMKHSQPQSLDVLLNAIYELKVDLAETIEIQKTTGKILASVDPVKKQVNELTCDVILKLVKDEYQGGTLPVKRLAQIIRRMLPDTSELKQLLPRLKELLLLEGMSLSEYLQLVRMLDLELESEALAGSLSEAAEGIGITVKEIIKAIKSEPSETARLICLASEIRRGTDTDDAQLSNLLTEYIEKISVDLAMDSSDIAGPQGGNALRKIIMQLETQLIDKLKKYGLEEPVLFKVRQQLQNRFEDAFDNATIRWVSDSVSPGSGETPEQISGKLINFLEQQPQVSRLREQLAAVLESQGFGVEQVKELLDSTNKKASRKDPPLPSNALSSNNMLFLLNREIKQHERYKTPFSTLIITIKKVLVSGSSRIPDTSDIEGILPPMFSEIKSFLRDIDLIGSLGGPDQNSIFVLLAMTDLDGAVIARQRLRKKLDEMEITLKDQQVKIEPVISVSTPIKGTHFDLRLYLEMARKDHLKEKQGTVSTR